MLIFHKAVDQSVLEAGLTIPVIFQQQLFDALGFSLGRGQKQEVQVLLDGSYYSAVVTNINFDTAKYPNHKDLLQIRYGKRSALCQKLRECFSYTERLIAETEETTGNKRISGLPEDKKEFLTIYSSPRPYEIIFDCITNSEFKEESRELSVLGEKIAEGILDGTDENASIQIRTKVCKIRKLTQTIIQDLKVAYGYRCQVCGEFIGEKYGSKLIHAHHIDYFTKSMNNNSNNIMILCPNHHGIIHDRNPHFDQRNKTFIYPNGYEEGLVLNLHL